MIEINNLTKYQINETEVINFLSSTKKKLKLKAKFNLSIVFVSTPKIIELNYLYRGVKKVTDVLSFSYDYSSDILEGEIIVCLAQAKKQTKRLNHTLLQETEILLTHGLLHLLGYDHEKKIKAQEMMKMERRLLNRSN